MNVQKEDMFTTYEVNDEGYCVNFKGKSNRDILKAVKGKIAPELTECLDYFSPSDGGFDPECRRVIVYTVRGGSEGYYTHVDMVSRDGEIKNLLLAKTLDGRPDRIKEFERALWDVVERGT